METVTVIKENGFRGVDVQIQPVREYVGGKAAPQIIGRTSKIFAGEYYKDDPAADDPENNVQYRNLIEQDYGMDDIVGREGIEFALEKELRGKDGLRTIEQDQDMNVVSDVITKEPQQGSTIMLTIDKRLQEVAQKSLEERITTFNETQPDKFGSMADAGSVVAIKVNTGEVLLAANFPSYDMETFVKSYSSLLKAKPPVLFNRALEGEYRPGSTFKPAMACIGLETGKLTSMDECIFCNSLYTRFEDIEPFKCLSSHGNFNVTEALCYSCNVFFYETGFRCGIETMNEYCRKFGLGVKTGIEVGETEGILAGPDYRKSRGLEWYPGDTVQAAIGQSDNVFSPLQLAVYCSTIANKGTRYQARLVKSVNSYDGGTVIRPDEPVIAETTGISKATYGMVAQGMREVAVRGTANDTFGDYPIQIGCKTGTAELDDNTENNNSIFIAYAPFDKPEIALAVVVEHTQGGYYGQSVARDIFDAYFFGEGDEYEIPQTGTLLE